MTDPTPDREQPDPGNNSWVPHPLRATGAMGGKPQPSSRLLGWAPQVSPLRPGIPHHFSLLIILLAAAAAAAPILHHGSFCGDDFEFHIVSWFDVHQSWLNGNLYPHWMPNANYGAGEPRFMFYPPLTWIIGAALGFILPWPLVAVAVIFLLLAATGFAVRKLALEHLSNAPATLAGCAALFSGYALFTAYERTAFAELAGGFWIPLVLLFTLRDRNPSRSVLTRALDGSLVPLAIAIAGCWLSDGPVGVMACYLMAAVATAAVVIGRSFAPLLRATLAAILGIALAAFYLLPAALEQHSVDLRAAVDYPTFRIENNWLFAHHTDPFLAPYAVTLYRASILAASMVGIALLSALVFYLRHKRAATHTDSGTETLTGARAWWIPLALIPVAVLFLQLPISLPVWNTLPKLRFLQYPWRWVLVVESPMAILFSAAVWPAATARRWARHTVIALCTAAFLTTTFFAARTYFHICREGDTAPDLLEQFRGGGGLEGTDEYEPPDSDHWKIASGLPDACFSTDSDTPLGVSGDPNTTPAWHADQATCATRATAAVRQPEHLRVAITTPGAGYLILRLVRFPAWRITLNGRPANDLANQADPRDDGLIVLPVPQGPVNVAVDWTTTPDVLAGRALTACAIVLLIALAFVECKRRVEPN